MAIKKIYLAGPDVFRPDAKEHGARKKAICASRGITGLFPLDSDYPEELTGPALAAAIYGQNMALIRDADAILANLSPFRGPNCDPGTAFELGAAIAMGKKTAAYMVLPSKVPYDLGRRTVALYSGAQDANEVWRDANGMEIENFGLPENLMLAVPTRIWFERAASDSPLIDDLGVFTSALDALLKPAH